jgi:hypothetical protein
MTAVVNETLDHWRISRPLQPPAAMAREIEKAKLERRK